MVTFAERLSGFGGLRCGLPMYDQVPTDSQSYKQLFRYGDALTDGYKHVHMTGTRSRVHGQHGSITKAHYLLYRGPVQNPHQAVHRTHRPGEAVRDCCRSGVIVVVIIGIVRMSNKA